MHNLVYSLLGISEQMFQFSFLFGLPGVYRRHLLWALHCLLFNRTSSITGFAHTAIFVYSSCVMSLLVFETVFICLWFRLVFSSRTVRWLQETCIIGVGCPARELGCAGRHSFHAAWRARAPKRFDYLLMGSGLGREGKGWLLGSSGIIHGDRLGMVRLFCTPQITLYRQRHCVTTLNWNLKNT